MKSELCQSIISSDPCAVLSSSLSSNNSITAYYIIAVGKLLHGVGTSMFSTTGFVYVAENGKDDAIPIFFGKLNKYQCC